MVVGFARNVIVGAGGGGGVTGGGGACVTGGGGATFLWQATISNIAKVRSTTPRFLNREELIAKPPCRITTECIRTMPVTYFFL